MKSLLLLVLVSMLVFPAQALTGRTAEPEGLSFGNFTSSTTWEWLAKGEDGSFHPTGQVIDMAAYGSYSLSKRVLVLNHKEVELEMDDKGIIIGFHSQSDGNNVGLFLGALILLCIMGVIIVAIAQTRNQPRRKGRALGSLYLLSLFLGDDHVGRD